MPKFAQLLSEMQIAGRPVKDGTGLTGLFKIDLVFAPDSGGAQQAPNAGGPVADSDAPAPIFTALREQLGLKLDPTRAEVPVLIVDHIERPTTD